MAFVERFYVETAGGSGGRGGIVFALDSEHDTQAYAYQAAEKLVESGHPVDLVRVVSAMRKVFDEAPAPAVEAPAPAVEVPSD